MNKIKPISLIINCLVISAICFAVGYKSAGMLYSSVITDETIISRIYFLEEELEKSKLSKLATEARISREEKRISNSELAEEEQLIAFSKKKKLEQELKLTEREIDKLTKKIEKNYDRLRKRNPEFKGAVNE